MWALARSIFEYACDKNLLVFLALIVLTCIICYCIRIFERSQDQNNTKFNWLGEKITGVEDKLDDLTETVGGHTDKIRNIEIVQTEWDKILKTKFEKEAEENKNARTS